MSGPSVAEYLIWRVGRFRLGQARRFLRDVAFEEGVRVSLDEEKSWPICTLYVTFRGSREAVDRATARVASVTSDW